jgi:hypothetical protein
VRLPRVRIPSGVWTGLKIVAVNLLIFMVLVVTVNIASGVLLSIAPSIRSAAHSLFGVGPPPDSESGKLPPYAGNPDGAQIWRESDQSRRVVYTPFVEWKRRPYRGKTVTVAKSGDRVVRPAVPPPPDAPVVRFLGGSTMWGSGAEDSETIPAVFQRLHPRLRAFNHGETEYNSRQNLERLINLLARGRRTDVAVLYEGFNDVDSLCRKGIDLNGQGEQVSMRRILARANSLGNLFYGRTLDLLRIVAHPGSTSYTCAGNPARARQVAETVLNIWRIARSLVQANCGRLVVALQPVAFIGHPRVDYIRHDGPYVPKSLDSYADLGKELRAVYPYWRAAARRPENRWIYDLTGAYDGKRPLYVDLVHVAEGGNEIMARRLGQPVMRALAAGRDGSGRCRH